MVKVRSESAIFLRITYYVQRFYLRNTNFWSVPANNSSKIFYRPPNMAVFFFNIKNYLSLEKIV